MAKRLPNMFVVTTPRPDHPGMTNIHGAPFSREKAEAYVNGREGFTIREMSAEEFLRDMTPRVRANVIAHWTELYGIEE